MKLPISNTLPETNIAHENLIFPGKYHQNGGFSMAMLVYRSVVTLVDIMVLYVHVFFSRPARQSKCPPSPSMCWDTSGGCLVSPWRRNPT